MMTWRRWLGAALLLLTLFIMRNIVSGQPDIISMSLRHLGDDDLDMYKLDSRSGFAEYAKKQARPMWLSDWHYWQGNSHGGRWDAWYPTRWQDNQLAFDYEAINPVGGCSSDAFGTCREHVVILVDENISRPWPHRHFAFEKTPERDYLITYRTSYGGKRR
jgi:hypothetical protein